MREGESERVSVAIHWIERSPYLYEARVTTADGADLYAGYVAVTPGAAVWRGYVGRGFVPIGTGPLTVMHAAVEQRVRDILAQGEKGGNHAS
jgi:hypothetical protein